MFFSSGYRKHHVAGATGGRGYGETGCGGTIRGITAGAPGCRYRHNYTADDDVAERPGSIGADSADQLPANLSLPGDSAQANIDILTASILHLNAGAGCTVNQVG